MNRAKAIAGARRFAAAAHERTDTVRTVLAWLLLAFAIISAGAARADNFDWRLRGVLFRVVPADNAPAADATPTDKTPAATVDAMNAAAAENAPQGLEPVQPPSYLFATIHYGSSDDLALYLPALRSRVRDARVLINEVDGNEPWRAEYEPYRSLPKGINLRKLLGEPTFAQLLAQLPGNDAATLEGLKPWVAMSMLESVNTPTEQSIDTQLQQWAREAKVRTVHLENLREQLTALDCVPPQDYALVLGQRLRAGWSFKQEAERTAGYYRERDLPAWLDEIDRLPGLDAKAVPVEQRARHCLIEARNERWLPMLEQALRQGDAFVAVGAIHLTGEQGLLSQLSKRGFTVTVEPW